ncbi:MAG: tetratricopeptide repeat protein, partial [Candidatus Natronoplasma sp.]
NKLEDEISQKGDSILEVLTVDGVGPRDRQSLETERTAAFYEFTKWLKKIAKSEPLVIFLDDLQWADDATLYLLNYVIDDLDNSPVLFIGAFRPEDITKKHLIYEIRNRLTRLGRYHEIKIKPLDRKYTREMLLSMLGSRNVSYDFTNYIHRITEGNPLFVKEFVWLLIDEEKIPPYASDYPFGENEFKIPKVVEEVLNRRVDLHISRRAYDLVQLGSVIGNEVPFDLLMKISKWDEIDTLRIVDELIENKVWEEALDEEKYLFSHKLLRRTIYENMPFMKKRKIHSLVGDEIKDLYKDNLEEYFSDLGQHYEQAGDRENARKYYFKAGEDAEKVYGYENAIKMYERALELSVEGETTEIEKKLGMANKIIGNYEEAIEHYREVIEASEDDDFKQRIYAEIGGILADQGAFGEALDTINKALSLSTDDESTLSSRCELLSVKGLVLLRKGEYDQAGNLFEEEMKIARNEREKGKALHNLGVVEMHRGMYEKAKEHFEKVVRIREKLDEKIGLCNTLNNLGVIYRHQGNFEEAIRHYESSLELRQDIGDKTGISDSLNNLGIIYHIMGEFEKALEFYENGLKVRKKIGEKPGIAISLHNIGTIYLQKGEYEEALKYFKESYQISKEIDIKRLIIHGQCGLAETFLNMDKYDESLGYAERGLDLSVEIGSKRAEGIAHHVLGQIYRDTKEFEKALDEFEAAEKIFDALADLTEFYKTMYEKSLLFRDRGEYGKSIDYLELALKYFDEYGMGWWSEECRKMLEEIE